MLIDTPGRFDGVAVIGVDEHLWDHTCRGDKDVTVIIDLSPVRAGTGPARLLDTVEDRSKQAFTTWLAHRSETFRARVEVVAMDGFTGFTTAAAKESLNAVATMDPFHVARLAGDALGTCRRQVQLANHGHHGHRGQQDNPLHKTKRTLHTGADQLTALRTDQAHAEVQATWGIYQLMNAAYRDQDSTRGRH